jgi:hypothetical protein
MLRKVENSLILWHKFPGYRNLKVNLPSIALGILHHQLHQAGFVNSQSLTKTAS